MPAHGPSIAASKLVSLGLAAKIGVGITVATASVAGAGAAGVLPDQANERARDAIETLTPVEFDHPADNHSEDFGDPDSHGENFGSVVSADATGESDGEPGVDGSEISSLAPGAAHRPVEPGQAPAQAGPPEGTGQAQATESPAAGHVPDDAGASQGPPSTTPDPAAGAPETPPSTVPEVGGPAADAGGTSNQPG
jgi:hypothetical protein